MEADKIRDIGVNQARSGYLFVSWQVFRSKSYYTVRQKWTDSLKFVKVAVI